MPTSAYGFSKLTGEVYCRAAHDEHGLPYTICRPFNAYGPGEMPEDEPGIAHAVPDLIRKSLQRLQPLPIFGTGEHTRTLTHVDDIADGIVDRDGARRRASTRTSTSPRRDELTVAEIAAHLLGGCAATTRTSSSSSTCRASRSTSCAAGRRSRRPSGCSAGRRRIGVEEGIAQTVDVAARTRGGDGVMPSALITGITGQDGSYLAELLLEKGYEVHGMVRRASTEKFDRIEHLRDRITLHQADLLDQRSLVDALRAAKPDEVYNLAAMSFVAVSWIQPTLTAEFTGVGVTRMLEAVREVCPEARFYQASSSEMFGKVLRDAADRDDAVLPALAVRRGEGLRPLHHGQLPRVLRPVRDAPGSSSTTSRQRRGLEFVTRKITWHAAAIKLGQRDELALGNLDAAPRLGLREGLRRGDVADAPARQARRLRDRHRRDATPSAAASRSRSTRPGSTGSRTSCIDAAFMRPAEVDLLVGDPSKAKRELGWEPKTSFEELIRLMVRVRPRQLLTSK